ncbi:MAG: flavodoxin family protein [Clostridia bacterium]|nr:flavodoxin family protein [Clostridia bacterium]
MEHPILIINGSPRGEGSNTLLAARALAEGLGGAAPASAIRELSLRDLTIEPCRGCFGCWRATPGHCVIRDDMRTVMDALAEANTVIVSFPVYFFGFPGPLKTALDRMIPVMHAYDGGETLHRVRESFGEKRFLFISTCGFRVTEGIYDALRAQLRAIFGDPAPLLTAIPQAELMQVEQMRPIVAHRLDLVRRLGEQLAASPAPDASLLREIESPLILPKAYHRLVSMMHGTEGA